MKPNSSNQAEINAFLMAQIAVIQKQIRGKTEQPTGEYLLPSEVCDILKIGKNKFHSLVNQGFLTKIKPDPKGRKVYVLRSQVESLFSKDFQR